MTRDNVHRVDSETAYIGPSVEDYIECEEPGCEEEAVYQVGIFAPAVPHYYCEKHVTEHNVVSKP